MSWLTKIKHSDEKTKKFWVTVLSGVSMAVVVFFWILYMGSYISEVGTKADSGGAEEVKFWPVFKTGITVIIDSLKEKFNSLTSEVYSKIPKIGGGKVINIENKY